MRSRLIYETLEAVSQQLFIERDRRGLSRFPFADHSSMFERVPVMAKEREADTQLISNLRSAHLVLIGQHLNDAQPRRIGQRFEYSRPLFDGDPIGCGRFSFHDQ